MEEIESAGYDAKREKQREIDRARRRARERYASVSSYSGSQQFVCTQRCEFGGMGLAGRVSRTTINVSANDLLDAIARANVNHTANCRAAGGNPAFFASTECR